MPETCTALLGGHNYVQVKVEWVTLPPPDTKIFCTKCGEVKTVASGYVPPD